MSRPLRVLGVDLSMTSTGVALVTIPDGGRDPNHQIEVRRIRSGPPRGGGRGTLLQRAERLALIRGELFTGLAPHGVIDLAVIEGPSYGSKASGFTQHAMSGNWWMLVGSLLNRGIPVAEVAPTHIKQYATGRGTTRGPSAVTMDEVVASARARWPGVAELRGSTASVGDMADALMLAAIGCRKLGVPIEADLPAGHLAVLTKTEWPEGITRLCP